MRRGIGLVLAVALILAGAYLAMSGFGAGSKVVWTGPLLVMAGALWIASDWFGL